MMMPLPKTICIVKRDGVEIGRVPANTPNLTWKIAEIASRGAVVEYVEAEPTGRKPAGNSDPFTRPAEGSPAPNKISHLEESREGEK